MHTEEELKASALAYHQFPIPGKIAIAVTKPSSTQKDLSLAYTPGVAAPVLAIAENAHNAYKYTAKGNLILIASDGTSVLGLGNQGPLASKPVMEGKAVLFKLYGNVDAFDIEVTSRTSQEFINTIERIACGFGGINLEDIAAPQCFEIQKALDSKLDIPVFHDDQHGTAIIIAAALMNALELQKKSLATAKIICLGAGAAGIASMKLLISLGANPEKLVMVDRIGVIQDERADLNIYKKEFAIKTKDRTLLDACRGADVFIGVSGADLMSVEMLKAMAAKPIVFALSNPDPEIKRSLAIETRDDLIMATGRSDYPNQVNNVLGFPYIFRGALDVQASTINESMMCAAVKALSEITRTPVPSLVLEAYGLDKLEFGPDYIIPKPNDPRLINIIPAAISEAAIRSGVARMIPQQFQHIKKGV